MRPRISPDRLQAIRKELDIERVASAASSRNRIRIDLIKAERRLAHAEQQMAYHKSLNNPNGVAMWISQKMFATSQVNTLRRKLSECR